MASQSRRSHSGNESINLAVFNRSTVHYRLVGADVSGTAAVAHIQAFASVAATNKEGLLFWSTSDVLDHRNFTWRGLSAPKDG